MIPEISVIVPVYKVEAYLPRCVESLLSQTYKDFEIIAVERLNGINNKTGDRKNKMFKELLIANYPIQDLHENG